MCLKPLLFVACVCVSLTALGQSKEQERLLLYNPSIVKHSYISSGKIIKAKDLEGNKWKGVYRPLSDSSLTIGPDTLLLREIQKINAVYKGTIGSQIGGVLLVPIGTAGLIVGAGLAVAGILVTEWLLIPAGISGIIGAIMTIQGVRNLKKKGKSRYSYDRSEWEYSINLSDT